MFKITDILAFTGFAWIALGIPLIIGNKHKTEILNRYGVYVLIIFGITLIDNLIKPYLSNPDLIKYILILTRNSYFLIGPFLLFYCNHLFNKGVGAKLKIIHLAPFFIWVIISLFSDSQGGLPESRMLAPIPNSFQDNIIRINTVRDILSKVSRFAYCFFIVNKIRKRAKNIKSFYSNISIRNTLYWLMYITILYCILFSLDTLFFAFPLKNIKLSITISTIARIAPSLIFIYFYVIFSQSQKIPEDNKNLIINKYTKSGMNEFSSKVIFDKVQSILNEKKLFTDPDINLDMLAKEVQETRHLVSEAINKQANQNFYSFINGYRLNEFIYAIKNNVYPNYTILAIAYECGFKSTSAFYSFFKKEMETTPKEFLKIYKVKSG